MVLVAPDPILAVREYLLARLGEIPISTMVPASFPPEFITLTTTGGKRSNIGYEQPLMVAQVWADDWPECAALANRVCALLREWPDDLKHGKHIAWVRASTPYMFPDPDSKKCRHQMTLQFSIKLKETE